MAKKKRKIINTLDRTRKSKRMSWLSVEEATSLVRGCYYDEEGALHNKEGFIQCTGVVKATGKRCKNFSIPGELFCRYHGGMLAHREGAGRRLSLYSRVIEDPRIKQVYEEGLANEEITGVVDELSLLRALLAKVLTNTEGDLDIKQLKGVSSIVGEIRQLVNDCTKAEIQLGQLIDIGKVTIVIKQLAAIVSRYITDKETLEKIADEFDRITWPTTLATSPQPKRKEPIRKVQALTGEVR